MCGLKVNFEIPLHKHQEQHFLHPVRKKSDVIKLWMHAIKFFLIYQPKGDSGRSGCLSIVNSQSVSRLFFESSDCKKIFSLSFPFSIKENEENIEFFSRKEQVIVDSRISSTILSLIQEHNSVLEKNDIYDFIGLIDDEDDRNIWPLLKELILAEDAYIRYDWDEKNQNPINHPAHHLDIYYSSFTTFKVGLKSQLSTDNLLYLLSNHHPREYLSFSYVQDKIKEK